MKISSMDVKHDKDSVVSDTMNNTDAIKRTKRKAGEMTMQSNNIMHVTLANTDKTGVEDMDLSENLQTTSGYETKTQHLRATELQQTSKNTKVVQAEMTVRRKDVDELTKSIWEEETDII